MTFYLKPLLGSCPLSQLASSSCVRLSYLQLLENQWDSLDCVPGKVVDSGQYYDEVMYGGGGGQWDRISYFALLMAASLDHQFRQFLVEAECLLFKYRIEREMLGNEIISSVKRLGRHLEEFQGGTGGEVWFEMFSTVKNVMGDRLVHHWVDCKESNCCYGRTMVPFTMVLPLVRERRVTLSLGRAEVNCSLVQTTLSCIFRRIMTTKLEILSTREKEGQPTLVRRVWDGMLEEGNIRSCFVQILGQFRRYRIESGPSRGVVGGWITVDMVETLSMYFPPCMAILYIKLKSNRKLKHNDRFQLSLFLKDIGLGMEEQTKFWAGIYSGYKTGGPGGNLWADRKGKYSYGIRHMYGLEGRRLEYKSITCRGVMDRREGDLHCPLVGDVEDISKYLKSRTMDIQEEDKVMGMCKEGNVKSACGTLSMCGREFGCPAQLFKLARDV